eukprot:CAMPEP_0194297850 /NCGR_PEP_ID=MMETSP0169-20130528/59838_1 /TAXON_ID=218684 /ORGANISM="Corethron pennatum, Strain L29A3" /LENGTH=78 /DNA_ID=CAMNT_0039047773 /DNA_START=529 /DNA_END=765 /DNA_ORIENTATION=+
MARLTIVTLFTLLAGAAAWAPTPQAAFTRTSVVVQNEDGKLGAGGMADTRDPDAKDDDDPRKSISAAPSFEEYLKSRE